MPLKYTYVPGPINIDYSELPIKSLISRLDSRLRKERENLLVYCPHNFQLGDLCDAPISNLENCFIYIVAISDKSYSSCKNELHKEIETAQNKALYRMLFRVTNERANLPSSIPESLFQLVIKIANAALFWWYRHQFTKDYINTQFNKHKTIAKRQFTLKVWEAFKKCREDMCVTRWIEIDIPYCDFWNNKYKQIELRKQIAKDNGNGEELEHVWLVKLESQPILVLLQTKKDLGKLGEPRILGVMDRGGIQITFEAQLAKKARYERKGFCKTMFSETSSTSKENKKEIMLEIILLFSPSLMAIEVLYGQLPQEYRDKFEGYYRRAKGVMGKSSASGRIVCNNWGVRSRHLTTLDGGKIRKTAVFVCYDYRQEKELRDRLNGDLKTLKKEKNLYKITPVSRKPSSNVFNAIDKSCIVIVLWGDKTQFSGSVKKEFEYAQQKNKPIILLDRRGDSITPLVSSLTKGSECVPWNSAMDLEKILQEVSERLLNEN